MIKRTLFITAALCASLTASAQGFKAHETVPGTTYAIIDPVAQNIRTSDPKQVEVVEVFSYTCGHCYALEAPVEKWLATKPEAINFVRLHMPGTGAWEMYAKTYFTLEALNKVDLGHKAFFDAVIKQRQKFNNKEAVAKFMATVGIEEQTFLKTWESFAVKTSFDRAMDLAFNQYKVDYTPVFIIDGKYLIDGTTSQAQSYEGIVDAVDKRARELLEEKNAVAN